MIISVKEARKILGTKYNCLSDDDLRIIIGDIEQISVLFLRYYLVLNTPLV
ncbi:MAG TPA: hypothetical protein VII94_02655 [Candidatus Saccharimonadales bacterium]